MKEIHFIGIMLCIIAVSIAFSVKLSVENKQLDKYNTCMEGKWTTKENCFYCDSISKH